MFMTVVTMRVRMMHVAIVVAVLEVVALLVGPIVFVSRFAIGGIVVHRVHFTHLGPIAQPLRA